LREVLAPVATEIDVKDSFRINKELFNRRY